MKATQISAWLFAAVVAGGCTGAGDVEYSGGATVASPELVAIEPGVQVIADADQPLFYAQGSYWLYRDNYWSRSNDYRGGFARVDVVPEPLLQIREPRAYVHYSRRHGEGDRAQAREHMNRQRQPVAPRPTNYYDEQQPDWQQRHDDQRQPQPDSRRDRNDQGRGQQQAPDPTPAPLEPARPPHANPMPSSQGPAANPSAQPNTPQVPPDQHVPQPQPQPQPASPRQGDSDRHDQEHHPDSRPSQDDSHGRDGRDDRTERNERNDRGGRHADEPTKKGSTPDKRDRDHDLDH